PDIGIVFAASVAALGMAGDSVAAARIFQHLRADIAGEGALGLGMAILAAERDAAAGKHLADRDEQCRWRTDQQLAAMRLTSAFRDPTRQRQTVGAQSVHLPIARDKPFSLSHFHSLEEHTEGRRRMVAAPSAPL